MYLLLTFQCKFSLSDQALGWLITFFHLVLKAMGKFSKEADYIAKHLPQTLYSHRQAVSGLFEKTDNFDKFSVCKECHTLYRVEECSERHGSRTVVKQCTYKRFLSSRHACGKPLMKTIVSVNGSMRLYPYSIYCCVSLSKMLEGFVSRPWFMELCESTRKVYSSTMTYMMVPFGKIF